MKDKIQYRELIDFSEYPVLEDIQRDAWKMPDIELVPKRLIYATRKSGGVVIGAFLDNETIGYVWGWIGKLDPYGVFIYSHHNAVRRKYQNLGIGVQLKLEQRKWALDRGYNLINWTFDPLQSKNGYINLHKLGATCNTYYENYWGEMKDALNIGMETDRLYCNWYLDSDHVKNAISKKYRSYDEVIGDDCNLIISTKKKNQYIEISRVNLDLDKRSIALEIPCNISDYMSYNKDLAIDWRIKTRIAFINYLKKGYKLTDFFSIKKDENMRCFHILEK